MTKEEISRWEIQAIPAAVVCECAGEGGSEHIVSFLQISVQENPFENALASVRLPESLKTFLGDNQADPEMYSKIQFNFFGTTSLFVVTIIPNECEHGSSRFSCP